MVKSALGPIQDTPYIGSISPGDLSVNASGLQTVLKSNFTAVLPPGVTDDADADYAVGSRWLDSNTLLWYICSDPSPGAAVWDQLDAVTVPAGSGTELQYRASATSFGAVTGSSVSGADLTLGGNLGVNRVPTNYAFEVAGEAWLVGDPAYWRIGPDLAGDQHMGIGWSGSGNQAALYSGRGLDLKYNNNGGSDTLLVVNNGATVAGFQSSGDLHLNYELQLNTNGQDRGVTFHESGAGDRGRIFCDVSENSIVFQGIRSGAVLSDRIRFVGDDGDNPQGIDFYSGAASTVIAGEITNNQEWVIGGRDSSLGGTVRELNVLAVGGLPAVGLDDGTTQALVRNNGGDLELRPSSVGSNKRVMISYSGGQNNVLVFREEPATDHYTMTRVDSSDAMVFNNVSSGTHEFQIGGSSKLLVSSSRVQIENVPLRMYGATDTDYIDLTVDEANNGLTLSTNGSDQWRFNTVSITSINANGVSIRQDASSATNAVFRPNRQYGNSGIGGTSDYTSVISDGVELARFDPSGITNTITLDTLTGDESAFTINATVTNTSGESYGARITQGGTTDGVTGLLIEMDVDDTNTAAVGDEFFMRCLQSSVGTNRFEVRSDGHAHGSGFWIDTLTDGFGPGGTGILEYKARGKHRFLCDTNANDTEGEEVFEVYSEGSTVGTATKIGGFAHNVTGSRAIFHVGDSASIYRFTFTTQVSYGSPLTLTGYNGYAFMAQLNGGTQTRLSAGGTPLHFLLDASTGVIDSDYGLDIDTGTGVEIEFTGSDNANIRSNTGLDMYITTAESTTSVHLSANNEATNTFAVADDGIVTHTARLDHPTVNESAFTINYTVDKSTSGNDTGLLINKTDTASPGTSYLIDAQLGGVSQFSVNAAGGINTDGNSVFTGITTVNANSSIAFTVQNLAGTHMLRVDATNAAVEIPSAQLVVGANSAVGSSALEVTGESLFTATLDAATGDEVAHTINYTVNKATSGDDTGLKISRTQTAAPGTSKFIDFVSGGTSIGQIGTATTKIPSNLHVTNSVQSYATTWLLVSNGSDTRQRWYNTTGANEFCRMTCNNGGYFEIDAIGSSSRELRLSQNSVNALVIGSGQKIVTTSTLDDATGDEAALTLNYTVNKLTSGDAVGLQLNVTNTASPENLDAWNVNDGTYERAYLRLYAEDAELYLNNFSSATRYASLRPSHIQIHGSGNTAFTANDTSGTANPQYNLQYSGTTQGRFYLDGSGNPIITSLSGDRTMTVTASGSGQVLVGGTSASSVTVLRSGGGNTLTLGSSQNATFAGNVTLDDASGPTILNEASSWNNPTLIPHRTYTSTGVGGTANYVTLVAAGTEALRATSSLVTIQQDATFAGNATISNNDSTTYLIVHNTGATGDPITQYNVGNSPIVTSWATGVDNSDSDKFKIGYRTDGAGAGPSDNTALTIDTSQNATFAGNVAVGGAATTYQMNAVDPGASNAAYAVTLTSNNAIGYYVTGASANNIKMLSSDANTTGSVQVDVKNANTGTGSASMGCTVGAGATGDVYNYWGISSGQTWAAGIDNSDGDNWKLTDGSTPSSGSTYIEAASTGEVSITPGGGDGFEFRSTEMRGTDVVSTQVPQISNGHAFSTTVPLYTFRADANTGIGSSAGDTLTFITAGAHAANFDSSQRLILYGGTGWLRMNGNQIEKGDSGNLTIQTVNSMILETGGSTTAMSLDESQKIITTSTLDDATGDEAALTLNYTVNKLTSGNDTGLLINKTDTASPGTSYLIDAQVGGTSRFQVVGDGAQVAVLTSSDAGGCQLTMNGTEVGGGEWRIGSGISSPDEFNIYSATLGSSAVTINNSGALTVSGTHAASSGTEYPLQVAPTINQSGTAGYTALDVNVVESATGSGTKRLINLAISGTPQFYVQNNGTGYFLGSLTVAGGTVSSDAGAMTLKTLGAGNDMILQTNSATAITIDGTTQNTTMGGVLFGDPTGTAAAPSIVPDSADATTGFYGLTTGEITMAGSGALIARISNSGIYLEGNNLNLGASASGATIQNASGDLYARTGDNQVGMLAFETGTLELRTGNTARITVADDSVTVDGYLDRSIADSITAFAGGGQGSATVLTLEVSRVTTVATGGDSVKLESASAGRVVTVINAAATNAMDLFPASGEDLGAGTDTAVSIAAGTHKRYIAISATAWLDIT